MACFGSSDETRGTPGCDASRSVTCFRDTAYTAAVDFDPGSVTGARWIWFAGGQDSLEFAIHAEGDWDANTGAISAGPLQEHDSGHNTLPYVRLRFPADGIIDVNADFTFILRGGVSEMPDTMRYRLSVRRVGAEHTPSLHATGKWARLNITSRPGHKDFSLIPVSIRAARGDSARWRIFAVSYKVALVSDSLYELCALPCSKPDTIKLTPNATVTRKY